MSDAVFIPGPCHITDVQRASYPPCGHLSWLILCLCCVFWSLPLGLTDCEQSPQGCPVSQETPRRGAAVSWAEPAGEVSGVSLLLPSPLSGTSTSA